MASNHKRDQWLQDIEARQRNVVFPDTVQNEARFWRNISQRPLNTPLKIGLALLALLGWGVFARLLFSTIQEGATWAFVLGMLLLWGPIFGVIAWATQSPKYSQRSPWSKAVKIAAEFGSIVSLGSDTES